MSVSTSTAELFDPGAQNRALLVCLVVSMALHALALLLFPGIRERAAADNSKKILVARIAPRVAMPEPTAPQTQADQPPPQAEPPKPRPEPKPSVEPTPEPRPALTRPSPTPEVPKAAPQPASVPAPSTPAETASVPPAVSQPSATASRAPEPQAPASPAARASPSPTPSPEEAGSMEQYRLALIGAAKKYKRYPAQAMEKGWQGKVEIRLVIGANGMTQNVLVKTSSGFEILDNQELDMVRKAKPLAPIPAALRGREFTVDVPVIFDLQTG